MKKQTPLILLIALYFSFNAYSQACGEGTLTLSIYTINGNKVKDISYEIFPASKEVVEKYTMDNAWESGKIIAGVAENDLRVDEDLTNKLNWYLEQSSISKSGKIITTLKFKTFEMGYFPI